jgi:acetyltransferase-like isoleucine patch superfamily enzyme
VGSLFAAVLREVGETGADLERRVIAMAVAMMDRIVDAKRARFDRVLPFGDYLVDRWDKARMLGFGEGSSVYDSCLVIGPVGMGRDCWVGPFTVLDGSGGLEIGHQVTISAGAQIYTHDTVLRTLHGAPIERSPVRIGNHVYIGPNAVIGRGVTIGDCVVIGANSVVLGDVAPRTKVAGSPARVIGTV